MLRHAKRGHQHRFSFTVLQAWLAWLSKLFKNVPFVTSFKMSPFLFSDSLFLS